MGPAPDSPPDGKEDVVHGVTAACYRILEARYRDYEVGLGAARPIAIAKRLAGLEYDRRVCLRVDEATGDLAVKLREDLAAAAGAGYENQATNDRLRGLRWRITAFFHPFS